MSRDEQWGGKRCAKISPRHRDYGHNLPCDDIDHLIIEYDHALPVGLVEHKHANWNPNSLLKRNTSLEALKVIAGGQPCVKCGHPSTEQPLLVGQYDPDHDWWWRVFPLNRAAEIYLPHKVNALTETEYRALLFRLRNRDPNADPRDEPRVKLGTTRPPPFSFTEPDEPFADDAPHPADTWDE